MAAGANPPPPALFDHLIDEPQRVRVLHQGPYFATIKTRGNFGVDLQMQGRPGGRHIFVRRDAPHQVEIPVLLADAIYAPTIEPAAGQDVVEYKIGSMVARLNITLPAALVRDRQRLDHFFDQMGRDVEALRDFTACSTRIVASGLATEQEMADWDAPLRATYDQVLSLHHMQRNGIWFRIVRNFFWSASAGRFDYVIGNPPWVRWSKLPEAYRERVKPTCEHYASFLAPNGMAATSSISAP